MANLSDFTKDELLIIHLVATSSLLIDGLSDVTNLTTEVLMAEFSSEIANYFADISYIQAKAILDNARKNYVFGN